MPMAAFDTMSVAKRLQDDFEMPQKQAEGVALVLHENFVGNVATKEDVKALDKKIDDSVKALHDKLDGKIDTVAATLKTEIAQSTNRAIYTLGGLVGILFVIDRIIPLFGVGN